MSVINNGKDFKSTFQNFQLVDISGIPLMVKVTDANASDSKSAYELLESMFSWFFSIQMIWADGGYRGKSAQWLWNRFQCELEITLNLQGRDFQVLPKRWIVERTFSLKLEIAIGIKGQWVLMKKRWVVERTFAWFEGFRRLSKDLKSSLHF